MREQMEYPAYVGEVLSRLEAAGFEAYIVGGSVRDTLLGRTPGDYDVTTSALPTQTRQVFADRPVIETGMQHGTVTVLWDHVPVEITTFRIDGSYSDARHPDCVVFTNRIAEDLSRRDFTVNAMAYHPTRGFVDPFDGRGDLEKRLLRAVREPSLRFSEDALRILRAFRFAAQLDFSIEEATLRGAREMREGLCRIARERVGSEWIKLLCAPDPAKAIGAMIDADVLPYVVGEFVPSERSLANLSRMPSEDVARMGLFFAGAPEEVLSEILHGLRCSGKQIRGTKAVVRGAMQCVANAREAAALIAQTGVYAPLAARASELLGNSPEGAEALVRANRTPTEIGHLAVSGRDLASLGLRGRQIGQMLQDLLCTVMEQPAYNTKETLMEIVKGRIKQNDE